MDIKSPEEPKQIRLWQDSPLSALETSLPCFSQKYSRSKFLDLSFWLLPATHYFLVATTRCKNRLKICATGEDAWRRRWKISCFKVKTCFETGTLIRQGKACSGMDFLFGKGMPAGVQPAKTVQHQKEFLFRTGIHSLWKLSLLRRRFFVWIENSSMFKKFWKLWRILHEIPTFWFSHVWTSYRKMNSF